MKGRRKRKRKGGIGFTKFNYCSWMDMSDNIYLCVCVCVCARASFEGLSSRSETVWKDLA
jgi:hypothetical protein